MKTIIYTDKAPAALGPYSQAIMSKGILYISGQIPINPENNELLKGVEQETHQVMKNLEAVLWEAGLNFSHVVKASIFLKDMQDFGKVNEIYESYLDASAYPARETVQVAQLPKDVSVEISMIAHTPD